MSHQHNDTDEQADTPLTSEPDQALLVVGTDGHRSTVRRAIGQPFPGVSVITSLFLADVRLAEKPDSVLTVDGADDVFAMIASFGDGWYRVMGWNRRNEVPDDHPLYLDEVKDVTLRALGTDYGMHDLARAHHPALRALRAAVTALANTAAPARTKALAQITGIGYRYPAPRGAHPLTGTRVPDVTLAGGRRLYEALRGGHFVLITPPTVQLTHHTAPDEPGTQPAVEHWADDRRTTVLVRPDGYATWAQDDAGTAAVEAAVAARFTLTSRR